VEKVPVTRIQRLEIGFRRMGDGSTRNVIQEAQMLTMDENIVDISFIVQYRVRDVSDYLFNIVNGPITVRDAAESAIREVIGRTKIDDVLTNKKAEVEVETQKLLQGILDDYKAGISVATVKLQNVQPPERVIKDFKDVASAREDKERTKNEAETYANDILPKAHGDAAKQVLDAEGYAKAEVARAIGESDRFVSQLDAYRRSPLVTRKRLYLETMQDVLSKANKVIVDRSVAKRILPYLPIDRASGKVEVKP
jgi:membrane protease subunit HflK